MASKIRQHTVRDMFNFWVRNERNKRPYLKLKYPGRTKNSELWYKVKDETDYLEARILTLDADIQKLETVDNEISRFTATTKDIFAKKREIYDIKEKLKELSKQDPNHEAKLIDFYTFRDVVYNYNKKVANAIIQGEKVNLSERLGYMFITKIIKPSKMIDWPASYEYKEGLEAKGITPKDKDHPDGKNWLVYYDSPYYFRWTWQKRNGVCRVKNHTVYGFYPTNKSSKGVPGVKSMLVTANKNNDLLHLNYTTR